MARRASCRYLNAFLDRVDPELLDAAPAAAERIHFTGRLEHDDLPDLLPACEAQVMPSTFPEAFGMVAAEAAACGAFPLSANHSGMAEVTATLAPALPEELRPLLAFDVGPESVDQIASKLVSWLELDPAERGRAKAALAAEAARQFAWESVAERVIMAGRGELDGLPRPTPAEGIMFAPREPRPQHGQAAPCRPCRGPGRPCRWGPAGVRRRPTCPRERLSSSRNAAPATRSTARALRATRGPTWTTHSRPRWPTGWTGTLVKGIVEDQIAHPRMNSIMPAGLVAGQLAADVASYVAYASGRSRRGPGRAGRGGLG